MSLKTHLQAWSDLFGRYKQIFAIAWQNRHENDSKGLQPHEAEFLPAALSLQETPVSPAPRVAMWLVISFTLIALLWACFGKIDIVATAQGKIVPNAGTKVIQPFELSTIKAIHVKDGQQVKAGDVLIELDATTTQADKDRVSSELALNRLQEARAQAMLKALDQQQNPVLLRPSQVTESQFVEADALLQGQYKEYQSKLALLDADIITKQAEQRSLQEQIKSIEKSLPISRQRAENFKQLADNDNVPKDAYLQREQQKIDQEGQLATGKSRLGLDRVLAQTGIGHYFVATRCADETASKPHPLMLQELLAYTQTSPQDSIMIGDTSYDMEMAQTIAMPRLAVSYGVHSIDTLKQYQPMAIVDSLYQLHDYLY